MATTSKKKSTTKSTVHQYVSTKPVNSYEDYSRKEYHWDDYNKDMPGQYQRKEYHWNDYNKGMPDAYKADTYQAERYNDSYNPEQYQSKYMPQIEQRLNDVANWKYDPLQDASYQALAAVYGARGNQAAKNSLADAAMLNGGYGTSNAVSAAQQARNQYNQELAALIPDLEQAAYNRAQTGLGALMDIDNSMYGRFSDDQSRQLQSKQFGLDVAGYNEGNRQWAAGMNQAEKQAAYNSLWDRYNTDLANRQWVSQMNQTERNKAYDSLWDVYNAQNANRQWVSSMNQNERQFDYNAGMDRAQLLNDYYKWATGENNALWEWNYAQANKGGSGGGGGGRGRSGGGGGYVSTGSTGTGDVGMPITKEDFEKLKKKTTNNKKGGGSSRGTISPNKKVQMTK